MGKTKEVTPEIVDEIIEEPVEVKNPMRDADPETEYVPAWEVVNDRQKILTDKIPPKIMSLEALIAAGIVNETNLATYLSDNGYVKNTDYAGTDTAGVVKVTASNGAYISTAGALGAASRTAAQYDTANNTMIIGKGTLENIKLSVVLSVLSVLADTADPSAVDGTVVSGLYATRQNGEWSFGFGTVTPPETP